MTSHFHISLRQLRESKGMSQEALGEELGVSRQAVGHWESGRMQPQLCLAIKIAKIFGTTVEEMMIVKGKTLTYTHFVKERPFPFVKCPHGNTTMLGTICWHPLKPGCHPVLPRPGEELYQEYLMYKETVPESMPGNDFLNQFDHENENIPVK